MTGRGLLAAVLILAGLGVVRPAAADEALWDLLRRGGQVVLLRHALAPGTGDPPGFTPGECATQRNLSEAGREQARRIGRQFRDHRVPVGPVLTSAWCRCVETATLAFGRAERWPAIDSFIRDFSAEPARTAALRQRVAEWAGPDTLVLVTHQVNITALTGIHPQSGEAAVLTPGGPDGFTLAGRLSFLPGE